MNSKSIFKPKISIYITSILFNLNIVSSDVISLENKILISGISELTTPSLFKEYKFNDLKTKKNETERLLITLTTERDLDKLSECLMDKKVVRYLDTNTEKRFQSKEQALDF